MSELKGPGETSSSMAQGRHSAHTSTLGNLSMWHCEGGTGETEEGSRITAKGGKGGLGLGKGRGIKVKGKGKTAEGNRVTGSSLSAEKEKVGKISKWPFGYFPRVKEAPSDVTTCPISFLRSPFHFSKRPVLNLNMDLIGVVVGTSGQENTTS